MVFVLFQKLQFFLKLFQDCVCGKANAPGPDLHGRIVGGTVAHDFQYPWQVGLIYHKKRHPYCGGSLITKQHVLTAGHCTFYGKTKERLTIKEIKIILGAKAVDGE